MITFTCGYCTASYDVQDVERSGFVMLDDIEMAQQVVVGTALHPSDEEWGKRVYAAWDDNKVLRRAYQRDGQSDISRDRAWKAISKMVLTLMHAGRGCPTCGFAHKAPAVFGADLLVRRCAEAAGQWVAAGQSDMPRMSVAKQRVLLSARFETLDGFSVIGRVEDTPYGRKNVGLVTEVFHRAGFDAPDSVRINKCGRNALIMSWT